VAEAAGGDQATLPLILQVSKLTRFGPFPCSLGAGAGYYFEQPTVGPDWKLRLVLAVLLPRGK